MIREKLLVLLFAATLGVSCASGHYRGAELSDAKRRITYLEADLDSAYEEQAEARRQLIVAEGRTQQVQSQLEALTGQLNERQEQLHETELALRSRDRDVAAERMRIQDLEQSRAALVRREEAILANLQRMERGTAESTREIVQLREELQSRELESIPHGFREVDRVFRNLPFGNIVFNTPKSMYVGDSREVNLQVSLSEGIEELKKRLADRVIQRNEGIRAEQVKIHSDMRATLNGTKGFSIKSLNDSEDKPVASSGAQQWLWEVEAKEPGVQRLHLTLTALIDVEGRSRPYPVETFSETIEVKVSNKRAARQFLESNWQWLWASIVAPLAVALWEGFKKLRSRRKGPSLIVPP